MFKLAFLVLAVEALVGIEYKKRPRIIMPGTGTRNVSMLGFEIVDYEARLVKKLGPQTVYGIHGLDDRPLLPSIEASGDALRVAGYESPVSPVVLASVFYEEVLKDPRVPFGSSVVVSARDYYERDEMMRVGQVFSNLELSPTVVPESTCAAAYLASRQRPGASERVYIVNFRGSRVVGTLYEISVEGEKDSVTRKITMLETAPLQECVPDCEIEKEVVSAVRDCLSERVSHPLSLLPFDQPGDWCADVEEFVYNLSTSLDVIPLVKFSRLEQICVDRSTGREHFETALTIDLGTLRESIFSKLSSGCLRDHLKEARCFYISDYSFRGKTLQGVPELQAMDRDAIVNGTGVISTAGYSLADPRVISNGIDIDPMYAGFVNELETKKDAQIIASRLEDHLSKLTYLAASDFKEIYNLVGAGPASSEDSGFQEGDVPEDQAGASDKNDAKPPKDSGKPVPSLAGRRTLENAKRVVSSFEVLISRNRKLSVDDALYKGEKLALERKIKAMEAEGDSRIKEKIEEQLSKTKEWLMENEANKSHSAFSDERMKLTIAHMKAGIAIREMERKIREELEKIAEIARLANERNSQGETAPDAGEAVPGEEAVQGEGPGDAREGEPPADNLSSDHDTPVDNVSEPDGDNVEIDWHKLVGDKKVLNEDDLKKLRDSMKNRKFARKVKEDPPKQEL